MTKLYLYDRTGEDIAIDVTTGEVYASPMALARITKRNRSTIKTEARLSDGCKAKKIPVHTDRGTRDIELFNEVQIIDILNRHRPKIIENITTRQYFHEITGFIHAQYQF